MVVETLSNILETGLLDRGELGELTGRQLLLDAYHRAVELEQGDTVFTLIFMPVVLLYVLSSPLLSAILITQCNPFMEGDRSCSVFRSISTFQY